MSECWQSALKAMVFGGDPGQWSSWLYAFDVACVPLFLVCLAAAVLEYWWSVRTRRGRSRAGRIICSVLIVLGAWGFCCVPIKLGTRWPCQTLLSKAYAILFSLFPGMRT